MNTAIVVGLFTLAAAFIGVAGALLAAVTTARREQDQRREERKARADAVTTAVYAELVTILMLTKVQLTPRVSFIRRGRDLRDLKLPLLVQDAFAAQLPQIGTLRDPSLVRCIVTIRMMAQHSQRLASAVPQDAGLVPSYYFIVCDFVGLASDLEKRLLAKIKHLLPEDQLFDRPDLDEAIREIEKWAKEAQQERSPI